MCNCEINCIIVSFTQNARSLLILLLDKLLSADQALSLVSYKATPKSNNVIFKIIKTNYYLLIKPCH